MPSDEHIAQYKIYKSTILRTRSIFFNDKNNKEYVKEKPLSNHPNLLLFILSVYRANR